jgi:hypothetical protein
MGFNSGLKGLKLSDFNKESTNFRVNTNFLKRFAYYSFVCLPVTFLAMKLLQFVAKRQRFLCPRHDGIYRVEVYLYSFLTPALNEGEFT